MLQSLEESMQVSASCFWILEEEEEQKEAKEAFNEGQEKKWPWRGQKDVTFFYFQQQVWGTWYHSFSTVTTVNTTT